MRVQRAVPEGSVGDTILLDQVRQLFCGIADYSIWLLNGNWELQTRKEIVKVTHLVNPHRLSCLMKDRNLVCLKYFGTTAVMNVYSLRIMNALPCDSHVIAVLELVTQSALESKVGLSSRV